MKSLGLAYHPDFLLHDAGSDHPDTPERILAICDSLRKASWHDEIDWIEAREAIQEEVALTHNIAYVEAMRRLCDSGGQYLPSMGANVSPGTYPAAMRAVGAGLTLADGVIKGKWKTGFSPTRPPGHHAVWERPMGLCVFNNIAILARYLIESHGLDRIAIIDFDAHHGNGTQLVFWKDPSVLYCSIHRDNLFPSDTGNAENIGEDEGEGFTLNIPLPKGSGDKEYFSVFDDSIIPKVASFKPKMILVSAGFDAHEKDKVGGMEVSSAGFECFGQKIAALAKKISCMGIISLLEGGYNIEGLVDGVNAYLHGLIKSYG